MASDNILDAVDRLEQAIAAFERILYGDPPARPTGLVKEFEGLRHDVQGLREDVRALQNRRPNVPMWVTGYVLFLVSGAFAIVSFINQMADVQLWDLSPTVALGLAIVFAAIALFMIMGGHGWLDGRT